MHPKQLKIDIVSILGGLHIFLNYDVLANVDINHTSIVGIKNNIEMLLMSHSLAKFWNRMLFHLYVRTAITAFRETGNGFIFKTHVTDTGTARATHVK